MTKITFGKYSGWETADLAKTTDGRSYLSWGAENLKSPFWRNEFQSALQSISIKELDINLEAESIMRSDAQIDSEDALYLAQETKADLLNQERISQEFETAKARFEQALVAAGVSHQGIRVVVSLMSNLDLEELEQAEKFGRIKFSDTKKRSVIFAAAKQYVADIDKIQL